MSVPMQSENPASSWILPFTNSKMFRHSLSSNGPKLRGFRPRTRKRFLARQHMGYLTHHEGRYVITPAKFCSTIPLQRSSNAR